MATVYYRCNDVSKCHISLPWPCSKDLLGLPRDQSINQSISRFLKWPKWYNHCKDHWLDVAGGFWRQCSPFPYTPPIFYLTEKLARVWVGILLGRKDLSVGSPPRLRIYLLLPSDMHLVKKQDAKLFHVTSPNVNRF